MSTQAENQEVQTPATIPLPVSQPPAMMRPQLVPVPAGDQGLELTSLEAMWRFANYVAKSGLAPKGIDTPEAVLVAVQMGAELGLRPMSALQNIAVINGRPSIYGDAQLALVRGSGLLEECAEWFEEDGQRVRMPRKFADDTKAVCHVRRRGDPEALDSEFSVADAKRSKLWAKEGPWTQYPFRMLRFRARGFALRDKFGDVLKGFLSTEEAGDIPAASLPAIEGPQSLDALTAQLKAEPPIVAASRTVEKAETEPAPAAATDWSADVRRLAEFKTAREVNAIRAEMHAKATTDDEHASIDQTCDLAIENLPKDKDKGQHQRTPPRTEHIQA